VPGDRAAPYPRVVAVQELSRADARRIAVRAQLLDRSRPANLLEVVRRRALLELMALIRPAEDLALYRANMARWERPERELTGWRARWLNLDLTPSSRRR
jgi:hypothetical protein